MNRKLKIKLVCFALAANFLVPAISFTLPSELFLQAAEAGVHNKLVEIDADERERLERERIKEQEEYERQAKAEIERQRREDERRRLEIAQKLRDEDIAAHDKELREELGDKLLNGHSKCGFWCKVWKVITFPVRMIAKPFTS